MKDNDLIIELNEIDYKPKIDDDGIIENPFKISKNGLNKLMDNYLSRKFDEDIAMIERKGGIAWFGDALQTDFKEGITDSDDFINRKRVFDTNEREEEDPLSFCDFVFDALKDRIVQILIVAALVSIIVHMIQGKDKSLDWIEGFAIVITVSIVIFVGAANNYDKELEFRELKQKNQRTKEVTVIRNGKESTISEEQILVGDILKIVGGMITPADGILIQGNNVLIDESAMTGETDMVEKEIYEECIQQRKKFLEENPQLQDSSQIPDNYHHKLKSPIVSSGTQIVDGEGYLIIIAVGINSQNGKIISMIEANKHNDEGTPLQLKLIYIADFIGYCGLVSAILTAIGMAINLAIRASQGNALGLGIEIMNIFLICIVVIVVAIPEGLPLAVTLTLAFSIKRMIQDQNLVRRMEACETMGGANYICSDKTGTLTKNEMNIIKIHQGVNEIDLREAMLKPEYKGNPTDIFSSEYYELFKIISACNSSTEFSDNGEEKSTFKTDLAFTKVIKIFKENVQNLRKNLTHFINGKKICIPFSSKRKKMSTVVKSDNFPQLYRILHKGGSDVVIPACDYYMEGNKICKITDKKRDEFMKIIQGYAELTLRTIILAYKDIDENSLNSWNKTSIKTEGNETREVYEIEESGLILVGIIGIQDILKDGVEQAVKNCLRAKINVIMVTGDNLTTACAIAKSCKIMSQESGKSKAYLGDAFVQRCGGIVCENCFKVDEYLKELEEAKKTIPSPEFYNTVNIKYQMKCTCYITEEEGKNKIRQKLIARESEKWKAAQKNEEEKQKFDGEINNMLEDEIKMNPLKIRKEIIANKEKFAKMIKKLCVVARSQPTHKYCLVAGLRELDNVVAVTGDGTNDAAALSKADVGFAMNNGTDIAKDAADIILVDNNFSSIVKSIQWGRNVFDNIRRFLQFQLSVNVVACILVFIGSVSGSQSPLSTIQMLWVNMIMDSLGSLALSTESPHEGLLDRAPGRKKDFIVNRTMSKHIIGQSIYQLIVLFIILFMGPNFILETDPRFVNYGFGFKYCFNASVNIVPPIDNMNITDPLGYLSSTKPKVYLISGFTSLFSNRTNVSQFANPSYCNNLFNSANNLNDAYSSFINKIYATQHYTIIFNMFIIMQLFNQICCRVIDDNFNIFFRISTNYSFFIIMLIEAVLQIIITQLTKMVFKVSDGGLGGIHWGLCIGFAAITFIVNFLLKLIPDKFFSEQGNKEMAVTSSKIISFKKGNSSINKNSELGKKRTSFKNSINNKEGESIKQQNYNNQQIPTETARPFLN